jgi:hypothetical protein
MCSSPGAGRLRRVARLLHNARPVARLAPIANELPHLVPLRDAFEAERRACCQWYDALGQAISDARLPLAPAGSRWLPLAPAAPAAPEPSQTQIGGSPLTRVVLDRSVASHGVPLAYAHCHLEMLAELVPPLASAAARVSNTPPLRPSTSPS